jgi:hypothetical protein
MMAELTFQANSASSATIMQGERDGVVQASTNSSQDDTQQQVNKKRILVLGSAPHTRQVEAYSWYELPTNLNVADYDVVVLNLVPLLDSQVASEVNWDVLPSSIDFLPLFFAKESEVVAIGILGEISVGNTVQPFGWWCPVLPVSRIKTGKEIRAIAPEFEYYFKHVKRWHFYASSDLRMRVHPNILRYTDLPFDNLGAEMYSLAETRAHQAVAFELKLQGVCETPQKLTAHNIFEPVLVERELIAESGRIIWLPPTTEISPYDAVNLLLQERYGLQLEQFSPDWVESYKLPAQIPIEAEIKQHIEEIHRIEAAMAAAQQKLQQAVYFRKLLYEQGVDGLEPVVRDALRELGAQVDDPSPKENREDGRLIDPKGRKGMLEIKGRTKSIKLEDVRQLDQWVRDALLLENWESKGILIGNAYCGKPPEQRDLPFPTNCNDAAKVINQCLLTTTQLFNALCLNQNDKLDVADFWDAIFQADGLCSLPELDPLDNNF